MTVTRRPFQAREEGSSACDWTAVSFAAEGSPRVSCKLKAMRASCPLRARRARRSVKFGDHTPSGLDGGLQGGCLIAPAGVQVFFQDRQCMSRLSQSQVDKSQIATLLGN